MLMSGDLVKNKIIVKKTKDVGRLYSKSNFGKPLPDNQLELNLLEGVFLLGDKKITLNFAICKGYPVDVNIVRKYFDPEKFIIKLTPINPTQTAVCNEIVSEIDAYNPSSAEGIVNDFRLKGYDVILSIGEVEENKIGSNCGQFVTQIKKSIIKK